MPNPEVPLSKHYCYHSLAGWGGGNQYQFIEICVETYHEDKENIISEEFPANPTCSDSAGFILNKIENQRRTPGEKLMQPR